MAAPQKPWKAEYAKSGRSSCKICKSPIGLEMPRLGKMVQSTKFDGFMPMWNHVSCLLNKASQIKSIDDVEGIDLLRWDDQQKIRKYVEDGGPPDTKSTPSIEYAIEVSLSSRAACKCCDQKIMKGQVRISSKNDKRGAKGLTWHHSNCFIDLDSSVQVDKLCGWETLPVSDQEAVAAMAKRRKDAGQEVKEEVKSLSKGGGKRKTNTADKGKSKAPKIEGDGSVNNRESGKDDSELEGKLKAQLKQLWDLKDDLKKHAMAAELRDMLKANSQDSTGSELDLRDRCADGMMFGALGCCSICSGSLSFSADMYRCNGYLSAWSKCSYSTLEPERLKGKWKIPEETDNEFLKKWFKSQSKKKPVRVYPLPSHAHAAKEDGSRKIPSLQNESLGDLKVAFLGLVEESMGDWKKKLEGAGGQVHVKIKKDTTCLVVGELKDGDDTAMKKARRMKMPIIREDYLIDCFKKLKKLPFDSYKVEAIGEGEASSLVTVKVKGQSSVHEASGLQDIGHILEERGSIFNITLNMSDLSTGINSYYVLQVIIEDKGSECYVFRKWGRVGNNKIGGYKLEEMPKLDAIDEFKRLFLEKTGNQWEAWEQKHNFQKQPGRFYPLDIDYGVNKQITPKVMSNVDSKLPSPLVELMKMLFDVETYKAAMMEFEINMSEMPLGKLSKSNIQKGFEALTEIQNLLDNNNHAPSIKESLIVDASNKFFTMIPSIHPHVIRDEDDFKSKVKMLEALQDIEIASRLVGFDADYDESLDDKYKKLNCDISPLPHDSEDYQLVNKFLQNTHAPTHTDWSLELEEVFLLEREGEYDKFAPYRAKLKNKMLLWHGSRLTNFVGILSQGLRIAPPEAPATGYMFGKGIYFADLVSKSAQYCFTDRNNPMGLMLLSEVALGEMHELKKAMFLESLPEGKHSTKGLGKKVPQESGFVMWRGDVTVPCGKPVPSNFRASDLMYNEYIVYNTAQVKLQFLLKVRFHHKR